MYRVIATNPNGSAYDKCTATVKKVKSDVSQVVANDINGKKAPKVLIPFDSIKIPEKESFTLTCKFSGEPKLVIKWFKDGEKVYEYDNCKLIETLDDEGNLTCQLIVNNAARSNGGGYRCIAENLHGTARTIGDVTVQCKFKMFLECFLNVE